MRIRLRRSAGLRILKRALLAMLPLLLQPCAIRGAEPAARLDIYGDALPEGAVARLGSVRFRHQQVCLCAFDPTGGRLFSCGLFHPEIRVWEVPSGKLLHAVDRQGSLPVALAIAPDGASFVVAWVTEAKDEFMTVFSKYDAASMRLVEEAQGGTVNISRALVCTLHLVGERRVIVDIPAVGVRMWDLEEESLVGDFPEAEYAGYLAADDQILLSYRSGEVTKLQFVHARSGKAAGERTLERGEYSPVLADSGGQLRVYFDQGEQRGVRVYDPRTWKKLAEAPLGKGKQFRGARFYRQGRRLLILDGQSVALWDVEKSRRQDSSGMLFAEDDLRRLLGAVSPDGRWIALTTGNSIELWDRRTWTRPLDGHARDQVSHVALSPDGALALTISREQAVQLWRLPGGAPLDRWHCQRLLSGTVAFTRDGKSLVTLETPDVGRRTVLDPFSGRPTPGPRLAAPRLYLRDVRTGEVVRQFLVPPEAHHLAVATRRNLAAVASSRGVELMDLASGRVVNVLPIGRRGSLGDLVLSPQGDLMAMESSGEVQVWDVESRTRLYQLPGRLAFPAERAFSPAGDLLLLAKQSTAKRSVRLSIHECCSGALVRDFEVDDASRGSEGFSPIRWKIVTMYASRRESRLRPQYLARSWNIGSERPTSEQYPHWRGHRLKDLSANGQFTVTWGGTMTVWQTPEGLLADRAASRTLGENELRILWGQLGDDAPSALSAMFALESGGEAAVGFLAKRLKPSQALEEAVVEALIAELDSDELAVRDHARKALAGMRLHIEPALRTANEKSTRVRIRQSTASILSHAPDVLKQNRAEIQALRAIQVLRCNGGESSAAVLRRLAAGCPTHRQTVFARRALEAMPVGKDHPDDHHIQGVAR